MLKKLSMLLICAVLEMGVYAVPALAANPADPNQVKSDRVIPYPNGYVISREGASSYNGLGNVRQSPYYAFPDFYSLKSTQTLTIISNYKTYQQTTEMTCGPAAALTVLVHFGNNDWDELKIAAVMGTKPLIGTDTAGMAKFFHQIGWQVNSSLTAADSKGNSFASIQEFKQFVIGNLKNNVPVLVENIDWGGHWRAIIGYDTLGTDATADDVLILADSYDTADHRQDGYTVNGVEKFFYMWFDAHMLPKDQQTQQWLVVKPPVN